MTTEELTALPKVELHCHLDGSLSRGFIEKRLGREVSQSELSVSEDCRSLNEYLEKFDINYPESFLSIQYQQLLFHHCLRLKFLFA